MKRQSIVARAAFRSPSQAPTSFTTIAALHLEPGVELRTELIADLTAALRQCAAWHGTPEVVVRQSDPPEAAAMLEAAL